MSTPVKNPLPPHTDSAPPELKQEFPRSFLTGLVFTAAVLLALPISQLISGITDDNNLEVDIAELTPPPLIEEPPPQEDEKQEEEIEELEKNVEPPTLAQLELSMSTDLSGLASSDFSIPMAGFGSQLDDIIYELSDLTRAPRPVRQPPPQYPPELRRARIEGSVTLQFVVRPDGTTSNIIVERSDNPAFDEPAVRAARRWEFEPGEKDGKAVSTRVRIQIPFTIR